MTSCATCGKYTENPKYCSKSCSAKKNNSVSPKRKAKPKNTCIECSRETSNPKFCSNVCSQQNRINERFRKIENGLLNPDKKYLLHLYGHQCQVCQNTTWNGNPIPIEIDHINGDSTNNTLQNLRLICPNCHAQTDTYKCRNRGNGRYYRRERYAEGKSF